MLQNRVTPFGELVADAARGAWTGNRGVLHDDTRRIVRPWQLRRWIICRLEFKGRHRTVMTPRRWTELFFLDEATALAAGHRPCAECRRDDFRAFRSGWPHAEVAAPAIDDVLHGERLAGRPLIDPRGLPDGAFVAVGDTAHLVLDGGLRPWSPAGYAEPVDPPAVAALLTPRSSVAVLAAGYLPQMAVGP